MTAYNLAQGGDPHNNPNYALYPQNAYVKDHPEYGASETLLKPAHHWEGGSYAAVRHMSFNDTCHQCGLKEVLDKNGGLVAGDTFLTHIVPAGSLVKGFNFKIHTPVVGGAFTVQLASSGTVLGTINAETDKCGWFVVPDGGEYVPCDSQDAIEFVVDAWPEATVAEGEQDPCGIYGPCVESIDFCISSTVFYENARAEDWCEELCYESGCCG